MLRGLRLFGMILLSAHLTLSANASIIDNPKFKVDGIVIVWQGESGTIASAPPTANIGPAISLSPAINSGPAAVITGTLLPLTENTPHTQAFPLHAPAQGETSFYVASNTAFNIDAELAGKVTLPRQTLETLSFSMTASLEGGPLSGTGHKAQYPHSGGAKGGINPSIKTLGDLRQRTTVFTGNQRTAAKPGTIAEQSVMFSVTYDSLNAPLPPNSPDVIFTVFVP